MISGDNSSKKVLPVSEYEAYGAGLMNLSNTTDVIDNLIKRRENAIHGGTNCIPFPFQRFHSEVPGVEQGQYVVITASQKTGKTQIANFLYVFSVLDYAYDHPSECSVHIIYFALEESVQRIIERYMSHLLFQLDGIRITPSDLRSTSKEYPIPQEALDKLQSEPYQKRLQFFEDHIQFETENTNPTGILRVCEAYAKSVGKYESHKEKSNGLSGRDVTIFDSYVQNDPNHYKICIIDHISLVDKEQGFRAKDSVDKVSEYFVKYLRNRYNYTCVAIQQQASESEGLEAMKQKRMTPTTATLSDSKYTARDADLVLGLFDPSKFGLRSWNGYIIQDEDGNGLKNYGRFLSVLANRNGEMGGVCSLFFDGATCTFEELPPPDQVDKVSQYYQKAKNIKSFKQQRKLQILSLLNFIWKKKRIF